MKSSKALTASGWILLFLIAAPFLKFLAIAFLAAGLNVVKGRPNG